MILTVGFGEASPEAKAARNLQDFFTYVAVKIVLAQLEVSHHFDSAYPFFFCVCVCVTLIELSRATTQRRMRS